MRSNLTLALTLTLTLTLTPTPTPNSIPNPSPGLPERGGARARFEGVLLGTLTMGILTMGYEYLLGYTHYEYTS